MASSFCADARFVALASLLYKAKIALTNFLLKGVLRSVIGQSLATVALELVTVPVTGVWNAVVPSPPSFS